MPDAIELERENAVLRAYVAELEARVKSLERLADSDTLTPLPNRRMFVRAVERAIAQLARHGTQAAVLFVDMNSLKDINDTHGHGVGDEALVHIAWVLREKIRASDVVARIGGDEFGVLLEYADEAAAREKAATLSEAVKARPLHGRIAISCSVGVTPLQAGDSPDAALGRADADMYEAKRRGGF